METIQMITNPVISSIENRRSIRQYTGQKLSDCEMATLMEAALQAPTGRNAQSCDIVFTQNKALIDKMNAGFIAYTQENGGHYHVTEEYQVHYGAPAFVFIMGNPEEKWRYVDGGIIAENIALAAESLGLGTCIIGMIQAYMTSPAAQEIIRELDVPENYEFVIGLAVGHPDQMPEAKPRDISKIHVVE